MKQYTKELGKVCVTPDGEWNSSKEYDKLCIVYEKHSQHAFISRQYVKAGIDISNRCYWMPLNVSGYSESNIITLPFNIDESGNIIGYSLSEAIKLVADVGRKPGLVLCFYNNNEIYQDKNARWEIWQFNNVNTEGFEDTSNWNNLYYNYNKFLGWFIDETALKGMCPNPQIGDYAHVGNKKSETRIYRCVIKGEWVNTNMYVFSDGSDLAQEPGQNDDIAMSQKAVTDFVNTLREEMYLLEDKVDPFKVISFTGAGIYEIGSVQDITLNWEYNREIVNQKINGSTVEPDLRNITYEGFTEDIVFTLTATDTKNKVASSKIPAIFKLKKYYGVSEKPTLSNSELLQLNKDWASISMKPTVFDCTGGKYVFYAIPQSLGSNIEFWIGGLKNTDWIQTGQEVINVYGHSEIYSVYRLTNMQNTEIMIEFKEV